MKKICIIIISLSLCGCATWVTPEPSKNITLEKAMESVAKGLVKMERARGDKTNGLYPKTVDIVFDVSAEGNSDSKLTLTSSQNTSTNFSLGGDAKGERSNKITIKFSNVLSDSTWLQGKSPSEILEELRGAGFRLEGAED